MENERQAGTVLEYNPLLAPPSGRAPKPLSWRSRVSVVEMVYHQTVNEQPTSVDSRFSRELGTDEQVYERRLIVSDAVPLDVGWVSTPAMIVIQNREGFFLQANPTVEEKQDAAQRTLEVWYEGSPGRFLVPAHESFRFTPSTVEGLMIRCREKSAKVIIRVYPG